MAGPSISVILTTHGRTALLGDALRDVAAQSHAPLEVRLADDGGGTDPWSLPALPLLELLVVPVDARQPGGARNAAAADARGEVLAFLDDDDRWTRDHLAGFAAAFADPGLVFGWRDCDVVREVVDAEGVRTVTDRRRIARDWDEAMMRVNDYLPPSAWAVRRELFDALDGFDPGFRFSEDWDFVLRAAARTRPRRVPGATVEVRLREQGNTSADFGPERLDCLARLAARHGLPPLEPRTFWEVARVAGEAP